jgi:hypothetical protein
MIVFFSWHLQRDLWEEVVTGLAGGIDGKEAFIFLISSAGRCGIPGGRGTCSLSRARFDDLGLHKRGGPLQWQGGAGKVYDCIHRGSVITNAAYCT